MTLSFPSPEFDDAVAAVCHGTATDAVMLALNELLRNNTGARDEYLLRVELHARLASDPDLFSEVADPAMGCPTLVIPPGEPRNVPSSVPVVPMARRRMVQVLALAACLVLAAVGAWHLWGRWSASRHNATSRAVAMLTRAVDPRWGPGSSPVRVGSALEPGWLRLESGMAQVVFYSGARVVIEGPVELNIVSPNEAACPKGRLLAEVPPPARGFRLKTDELNVVDLGTAFGIDASHGRTEVHVFKGVVDLHPGTTAGQALKEGQAAVVQGNASPRLMAANTEAFAPMFEFQKWSLASEAVRFDQWRLSSARLRQDPTLVVHFDFEDLGDSDWTLHNGAERNQAAQEGTIVGCQRAQGRWREKQALEFQSVSDRVLLAVPGEFQALTLSAWVCVKGLDREFNSLFMSDGFEPGTIHWLIRNDGVLGLTVFGEAGNYQILASPRILTLDKLGMWVHLAVVLDGNTRQVVHYVNGAPVSHHDLKMNPPFQIGPAELGNWNTQGGPNPEPFLIRNLSGSFDEFELFDRALSAAEIRELHIKGKPDL